MKYSLMMQPEPSQKSLGRRVDERMLAVIQEVRQQGLDADTAMTTAMIQHNRIIHEEIEDDNSGFRYGGSARRHIKMLERRRRGRLR